MARMYDFAVLRLMPDVARGEAINIGIVVFQKGAVDVRVRPVITRARLLYPDFNQAMLQENLDILKRLASLDLSSAERHRMLDSIGPLALGQLGYFSVTDAGEETYEANISRLLTLLVAPARTHLAEARSSSKLVSVIRKAFRHEKVLAAVGDAAALAEHKIVPEWPLPNSTTLKADLALRNGIMRVCEIVDIGGSSDTHFPSGLYEGVVTLDAAQQAADAQERVFAFRASGKAAKVDEALKIANLHATRIVNWDSATERDAFMNDWLEAARPADRLEGALV